MSRLEQRYRSLLRVLPAAYRQAWEPDMVAAFLESMATDDPETSEYLADYGRPSAAEVASVVALAIRLRVGGSDAPPRPFALGQAVRLAVLVGTLLNAVMVTADLALRAWASGKIGWLPTPSGGGLITPDVDLWHSAWSFGGAAWLPAYLLLVVGVRRAAQALAALAVGVHVVNVVALPLSATTATRCLLDLLLLAGMAAFPDGAPSVRRRPWLLAVPIGVLCLPAPLLLLVGTVRAVKAVDWPGITCVLIVAAILTYLAGSALGLIRRTPQWSLALTLLAAVTLALRLLTLVDYRYQVEGSTLLAVAGVEALAVLAFGLPLAVSARRALRQLPASAQPAGPAA